MSPSIPTHAEANLECPAELTTLVCDPLSDEILLRLAGAVVLPASTMVDLSGGEVARVASLRLNASETAHPHLIVQVVRSRRAGPAAR